MFIKNFEELATTPEKRMALEIAESALSALDTKTALLEKIDLVGDRLSVDGQVYDLSSMERLIVVGFGKVALSAVSVLYEILAGKISCGFVLDVREGSVGEGIVCRVGTHPRPTLVNVSATEEMLSMLTGLSEKDLVICVVSGGGSSLLCSPKAVTCQVQSDIEDKLTFAGAPIDELNTVRKHLSRVKGGQLAVLCRPARLLSLIFSDVPGGSMDLVASGPTVLDTSTILSAKEILLKRKIFSEGELSHIDLFETPKDPKLFSHTQNVLVVSAERMLKAACEKARVLGFTVKQTEAFSGEAKFLGEFYANLPSAGECVLAVGESTVTMDAVKRGVGGRNQELALSASTLLEGRKGHVLLALASDGFDNTEHAGALVDDKTITLAKAQGIHAEEYLMNHNSFSFFEKVGGYILTGKTGFNVADLIISLKR